MPGTWFSNLVSPVEDPETVSHMERPRDREHSLATDLMTTEISAPTPIRASRLREGAAVALGTIAAVALGILARLWMRLIAESPDFTWGGTIFIVMGFTIFGLTQSVTALARRRRWRPWAARAARAVGFVGLLPLFVGAGAVMVPTVIGGGLAVWRTGWPRIARGALALVAAVPVIVVSRGIVDDFGWSVRSLAGIAAMVVIYGIIVRATRATLSRPVNGWRFRTVALVVGLAAAVLLVAQVGLRSG